jgi:hypothetical protein
MAAGILLSLAARSGDTARKRRLASKEAATAIMKTREERRKELKRLAAMPNGIDRLYAILTRNFIPFENLPIGTLMIEAILDHEYSENKSDVEVPGLQESQKPGTTCRPAPG